MYRVYGLYFYVCSHPPQLYPYHLQDVLIEGLRLTPFIYYCGMIGDIMQSERSYDALPNFTAADCKALYQLHLVTCKPLL